MRRVLALVVLVVALAVPASAQITYTPPSGGASIGGAVSNADACGSKLLFVDGSFLLACGPTGLSPTFTGLTLSGLTANRPVVTSAGSALASGAIDLSSSNYVTGALPLVNGGTGTAAASANAAFAALSPLTTLGDLPYYSTVNARLPGNTTATKQFLSQTGTGAVSAAPAWGALAAADVPGVVAGSSTATFVGPTAPRIFTVPDVAATLAGLGVAQTWSAAQVFAPASAENIPLTVKGYASQSAATFVVEQSDGTDILTVGTGAANAGLVRITHPSSGYSVLPTFQLYQTNNGSLAGLSNSSGALNLHTDSGAATMAIQTTRLDMHGSVVLNWMPTTISAGGAYQAALGKGAGGGIYVSNLATTANIFEAQDNTTAVIDIPNGGSLRIAPAAAAGVPVVQSLREKALAESNATSVFSLSVASGAYSGGKLIYTVVASDATDHQARSGAVHFAAVNKAGTETCAVYGIDSAFTANPTETQDGSGIGAISSGTLTYAWAADTSDTNACALTLNAVSSLTQTVLKIHWTLVLNGPGTVTPS